VPSGFNTPLFCGLAVPVHVSGHGLELFSRQMRFVPHLSSVVFMVLEHIIDLPRYRPIFRYLNHQQSTIPVSVSARFAFQTLVKQNLVF